MNNENEEKAQLLSNTADQTISKKGATEDVEADIESTGLAAKVDDLEAESNSTVVLADTRSIRARRWSALNSITVRNFKAAVDAIIPVDRVTILVGPNGCGKSSVLQAIHWAARAASYVLPKNTKEMISFERLDYIPSSEPLTTFHKGELRSDASSSAVEVVFAHQPIGNEAIEVTVKIRAARNRGGITVYMDGGTAVTPYKQRYQFITTYIPGLAGLSERETILAQPTLRRQAASGDAGGVLRNILFNLRSRRVGETDDEAGRERLDRLNKLIGQVHPGIAVDVSFDEREDFNISASIQAEEYSDQLLPLETSATGVLQVIQIFAYLILFEPKVMLIDEPDAHLHPDKQERLIEALERASAESDTQMILTTHSPHIVRASSPSAKLVWMREGRVQTEDDEAIRRMLGWGGLDKSAFFFVEDEEDKPFRAILRQWPELGRQLAVCRCFGINNLPRDKFLEGLLIDGQLNLRAIVHRDRDFMTSDEVARWRDSFETNGVFPWVTAESDIESYFCEADYLAHLYDVQSEEANAWRNEAAQNIGRAKEIFLDKRKEIVRVIWPNGGSPDAEVLWNEAGGKTPTTVRGKSLFAALKAVVKNKGKDNKLLDSFTIPSGCTVAEDLKAIIESALK